ncbi:MAG: polysaccharide deacetylase family protein [Candidatus Aenigmarchaeota archaeon]|nr:polysaccharide deacetylase family protein [Candidatus Aenigmarchaeota archaeon]
MYVRAYFFFKRVVEYLGYVSSGRAKRKIVVLTFDDYIDAKNIEIAEYLKSRHIPATFFLTLDQTKPEIIKQLVNMAHEIAGHSLSHSREEREGSYQSAKECYKELSKYDGNVVSWRFPWTSRDEQSVENVKNAGFSIDSSVGTFYPVKKLLDLGTLYEIPWLRLPKQWQMDVNEEDYAIIKNYIIKSVESKNGIFVLGFHTYYQYKKFQEFKDLIEKLVEMEVEFITLREAFVVLKNGKL